MNARKSSARGATLRDVALAVGVSPGTVSRVLTRPELVAVKTREAVLSAISRLRYVPNAAGRNLRSSSSMTIGAVIPKSGVSTFSQTILALNDALQARGYTLIVSQPDLDPHASRLAAYRLIERGADGLILLGEDQDTELLEMLDARHLPYVMIWTVKRQLKLPHVTVDQVLAGHLAAEHLLSLGHRHFAFVSNPLAGNRRAQARLRGVKQSLAHSGIRLPDSAVVQESHRFGPGGPLVDAILANHPETTAIVCSSDYLALGVLRALYERGKRVPEDISLVSFNNSDFSAFTLPAITTVNLMHSRVGGEAAESIVGLISRSEVKSKLIQPELVVRESSGPAPAGTRDNIGKPP